MTFTNDKLGDSINSNNQNNIKISTHESDDGIGESILGLSTYSHDKCLIK